MARGTIEVTLTSLPLTQSSQGLLIYADNGALLPHIGKSAPTTGQVRRGWGVGRSPGRRGGRGGGGGHVGGKEPWLL